MALASQGISTPKINLREFLISAHNDFKEVAKQVHGQLNTSHYLDLAMKVQKLARSINQFSNIKLIEELEKIRHHFYQAAEAVSTVAFPIHLLQQAVQTQTFINKLRA